MTVFPQSNKNGQPGEWSPCAQRGIAVKPRQGDALLFFSMDVRGPIPASRTPHRTRRLAALAYGAAAAAANARS